MSESPITAKKLQQETGIPNDACRGLISGKPWSLAHWQHVDGGKEMSDTARYRMTGNGIVAPVARWLAEGVKMALNHDLEEVA